MRASIVAITAAILGTVIGIGTSWARLGRAPDFAADYDVLTSKSRSRDSEAAPLGPQPVAVTDGEEHDFGMVERHHVVEHAFRFTNRGPGPLVLKSGGTTCLKCTVSKIPDAPILPGESANVVVQYNASIDSPQFRQSATILTNDPQHPRIVLTVSGQVASSYSVAPSSVVFSKVTAGAADSTTFKVISYLSDSFQIDSFRFTDADTAEFFQATVAPVPADELTEPHAKRGCVVTVTVRPGLPLGPFRQTLVLETNLPSAPHLSIPVEGTVVSNIAVAGPGWDREHGVLILGVVRSAEGIKRNLWLLVHGDDRHDIHVSVGRSTPDFLRVELGEPVDSATGSVVRIPLVIEVPPGTAGCQLPGHDRQNGRDHPGHQPSRCQAGADAHPAGRRTVGTAPCRQAGPANSVLISK